MYKSIILPLAQQDIKKASIWYNTQKQGLWVKFITEIRKNIVFIKQNPAAFAIHYFTDEHNKTIIISAVLHTSRNPQLWEKR